MNIKFIPGHNKKTLNQVILPNECFLNLITLPPTASNVLKERTRFAGPF